MKKILTEEKAVEVSQKLKKQGKKIVLVGGCFDLLHVGHIRFLKKAKKLGIVFVLLESDESIKRLKGKNRPIIPLEERAEILSAIFAVNFIVKLGGVKNNQDYAKIVSLIGPDFIAITKGDTNKKFKEEQARKIKAKIVEVTEIIPDRSSSSLAKFFKIFK